MPWEATVPGAHWEARGPPASPWGGDSCELHAETGLEPTAFETHSKHFPKWTTPPPSLTQGQFGQLLAALTQMHADTQNETPARRKAREGIDSTPLAPEDEL